MKKKIQISVAFLLENANPSIKLRVKKIKPNELMPIRLYLV